MPKYIDVESLGIKKANPEIFENKAYADGWNAAIDIIVSAPTADVEEIRHGEWIYEGHHEMMGHVFQCSVCGRWMFTNSPEHVVGDYPYCHCGVKMESVKGFPRD